jgi:hypothetical protein
MVGQNYNRLDFNRSMGLVNDGITNILLNQCMRRANCQVECDSYNINSDRIAIAQLPFIFILNRDRD